MTTRRENERDDRNRDRGDRYKERGPRQEPREPVRRNEKLNEFFVDGDGIHRDVMQREICKYLGAEALSRPAEYNVRQPT